MGGIQINILLIVVLFVTVNCKVNLTYDDKIAYAGDGLECLNNCVNGTCVVDDTLQPRDCQNTDKNVPVHRTIHDKICLSRCWKDPVYTGRCYIDNDKNMDYCDSSRTVEWILDRQFTEKNGPCKDICRREHKNDRSRCNHYWIGFDYCDPQWGYNYIQARTITGELCRGMCKQHNGIKHNWCYYGMRQNETCVLPGMPRPQDWSKEIKELLKINKPICIRKVRNHSQLKSIDEENMNNALLDKWAQDLEYDPKHDTVFVRDKFIPIYSYTVQSVDGIPRVVRATIRPRDLVYRGDADSYLSGDERSYLEKMGKYLHDEIGYLISYFLNGSAERYNLFNKKPSNYDEDKKIVKFLEDNKHVLGTKVELLVVVLYRGAETRPSGIARHVKFYHSSALADEYYEYLPNDSGDDTGSLTAIGEKSLLPAVDITRELANGDCYSYHSDTPPVTDEAIYEIDLRNQFSDI